VRHGAKPPVPLGLARRHAQRDGLAVAERHVELQALARHAQRGARADLAVLRVQHHHLARHRRQPLALGLGRLAHDPVGHQREDDHAAHHREPDAHVEVA
jgi:hypothetical protein